jgi:hypothetical protein
VREAALARAASLTPERRSEIAREAGRARWSKYTPEERLQIIAKRWAAARAALTNGVSSGCRPPGWVLPPAFIQPMNALHYCLGDICRSRVIFPGMHQ